MPVLSKSKTPTQRPWRPDFRIADTLPDTKVIRTGFLLNFIAIALAAIGLTLYGVREYQLQGMMRSVSGLQKQVEESTSRNRALLDSNKRFRQSAEVVEEAVAFEYQPFAFDAFISQVAGVLPEGVELTEIELQSVSGEATKNKLPPFNVQIKGKVLEDAPGTPAQILNAFQEGLAGMEVLKEKKPVMEMSRFSRNNDFGHFDFTLLVKIPVEKAPSL